MTSAHAVHAAARAALLFAPGAAVFVAGIPGAGKTTFLAHTVRPDDALVLDSADVRRRMRTRLGRRVPYGLYRPHVHLLHVWRALARPAPVVVHDCGTRGLLRRVLRRRAACGGRPVCLLLLEVDPALARGGQHARGRRVRARTMRRHERRWSRMVTGTMPRPTAALLAEGFADVRVLDRDCGGRRREPALRPPGRPDRRGACTREPARGCVTGQGTLDDRAAAAAGLVDHDGAWTIRFALPSLIARRSSRRSTRGDGRGWCGIARLRLA